MGGSRGVGVGVGVGVRRTLHSLGRGSGNCQGGGGEIHENITETYRGIKYILSRHN